jgi:4-carboxymuconolactone decarboxylase
MKPDQAESARRAAAGARLLRSMKRRRGYILPFHELLASRDPAFLRSYDAFLDATLLAQRRLDRRTKELVLTGVLTAIAAPRKHIAAHVQAAIAAGATQEDVLEALELVLPSAGVARFMEGLEVWEEAIRQPAQPRIDNVTLVEKGNHAAAYRKRTRPRS